MSESQPFEAYPKLEAAIRRAANEARMPLTLWDALLGEINASLAAARRDALEEAAKVADGLAEEQEATNTAYPRHAAAYPSWRNAPHNYRRVADRIRTLAQPDKETAHG